MVDGGAVEDSREDVGAVAVGEVDFGRVPDELGTGVCGAVSEADDHDSFVGEV